MWEVGEQEHLATTSSLARTALAAVLEPSGHWVARGYQAAFHPAARLARRLLECQETLLTAGGQQLLPPDVKEHEEKEKETTCSLLDTRLLALTGTPAALLPSLLSSCLFPYTGSCLYRPRSASCLCLLLLPLSLTSTAPGRSTRCYLC